MANVTSCLETKARFLRKYYEVDQKISVEVYLRNTSPFTLNLCQVSVCINTSVLTSEYNVNSELTTLVIRSNEVKKFLIEFYPDPRDISKDIQVRFHCSLTTTTSSVYQFYNSFEIMTFVFYFYFCYYKFHLAFDLFTKFHIKNIFR